MIAVDPAPTSDPERLRRIQRRFGEFATEYAALPLYAALCRRLAGDDEAASLLLAARPGQARPVLWLAAVHELVLRRPESLAAQWYPSVMGHHAVADGDPWPDVRRTVMAHRDELVERIATHGTQTNEVNRAVYVAAALAAAAADAPDVPVALVELGASAGLLLGVDRYAVELAPAASTETASGTEPAPVWLGDVDSPVRCSGLDRTGFAGRLALAGVAVPPVHGRVGIDLAPVALDDDDGVRWLEACLWPDVPGRVERFRAARDLLRADPPAVLRGDMVGDLPRAVARARDEAGVGAHVVVLSSWALTYVPRPRRLELEGTLARLAGELARLSWLTAEPPGCAPGIEPPPGPDDGAEGNSSGTVVGLRRWRGGRELDAVTLGTCHPHGTWVDLRADAVVGPTS